MTKTIAERDELVELRVRISPEHYRLLNRIMGNDAKLRRQSMSVVGGQMLTSGLLQHQARVLKEIDRACAEKRTSHDVVAMFARGMPITAIAAMTKMRYTTIARLIGERTDIEVQYARELA
jgi:small-conductance mechanosensitive channel